LEPRERLTRSGLLGRLLRGARAGPRRLPVDRGRAGEAAIVRRALDLENRVRDRQTAPGELFLELRLEVDVALDRVVDPVRERGDDRLPNRLEPMLEVQGTEGGLDERSQDVPVGGELRDFLGVARLGFRGEALAELQPPPDDRAALALHDVRADLRQAPFLVGGKALVELLRDGETEHTVAQELEALVGVGAVPRPRGMCERVAETLLRKLVDQLGEIGLRPAGFTAGGSRCSRRPVRQSGSPGRPRPRS
jgi:hypothetical protein